MMKRFPNLWLSFVDHIIPNYVKSVYSPKESWKNKQFSKEDVYFFFKGIDQLSTLFTDERPRGMPAYFSHPKFRSAYLLYFLPLQAAKFLTLFQMHAEAIQAALTSGYTRGVMRIADLGAGPGTGSISLLLKLIDYSKTNHQPLPRLEFYWYDTQESIMRDGMKLMHEVMRATPELQGRVSIFPSVVPWWKAQHTLPESVDLILMGHILNESHINQHHKDFMPFWSQLLKRNQGGGILIIDPASRKTAQQISRLRDVLLEMQEDPDATLRIPMEEDEEFAEEKKPAPKTPKTLPTTSRIWGPCLHMGLCPLREGRDWCHFSSPLHIPGRWFKHFSEGLGSERQWIKYSYLWIASENYPAPQKGPEFRLVLSDPLTESEKSTVLLCEPGMPRRWNIVNQRTATNRVRRGEILSIPSFRPISPARRKVKLAPKTTDEKRSRQKKSFD